MFSLENEASFNAIYAYYTKMSHYRNAAEIPIILVGTQGQFTFISSERVFMERLLLLPIFGSNTVASIDGFVSLAELTLCKFLRLFLKPFFSFPSILIKTRCD